MNRRELLFPAVLVCGLAVSSIVGQVQWEIFTDEDSSTGSALFLVILFAAPFVPIAICLLTESVGVLGGVLAFATGVAALVLVPWLMDKSIEGDDSSTAGLVHLWDPVLDAVLVGVALLIAWGLRRARRGRRGAAVPPGASAS
jgi:hypothetical protein